MYFSGNTGLWAVVLTRRGLLRPVEITEPVPVGTTLDYPSQGSGVTFQGAVVFPGGTMDECSTFARNYEPGWYVELEDHAGSGPYEGEYYLQWSVYRAPRPAVGGMSSYACGPFLTFEEADSWRQKLRDQIPLDVRWEDAYEYADPDDLVENEPDENGYVEPVIWQYASPDYDQAAVDALPIRPEGVLQS